jgi:CO/xanthine dehydrogenase FAD-binding subunit
MITAYHRPQSLEEALKLLARPQVRTLPLGGGTQIDRKLQVPFEVVDVQSLGMEQVQLSRELVQAGAAVRLQALLAHPELPDGLCLALELEASYNLRQVRTIAGALLAADGRSPLATTMLALDASLRVERLDSSPEQTSLGALLALQPPRLQGGLATRVEFPRTPRVIYDYVARTPADLPIVCVAAARWPSGRTRLAVGGFGSAPRLAMDGPEESGWEAAVRNACASSTDQWASAEYRQEAAAILAGRCVQALVA